MAAPSDWRSRCNQHPIFQAIRKGQKPERSNCSSKSLLIVQNKDLYVYDATERCIRVTNLLLFADEAAVSETATKTRAPFQTLSWSTPINFKVDHMLLNITGQYIALVGEKGLTAVELPYHRGKHGEFNDGPNIECRTIDVGQRFFVTSGYKLLQAAWHPGSPTDLHLTVLSSDNCIRIYNLQNPDQPEQTLSLGRVDMYPSPTKLQIKPALGDTAVAFDFGPSHALSKKYSSQTSEASTETHVWPMYVLWGNGEVYLLNTAFVKIPFKPQLKGPLTMFPAADDNYGTDACSILCLQTSPLVLVIATCEGKLHHCVVLGNDTESESQDSVENGEADSSIVYDPLPCPSLYVYEAVELELSLRTVDLDTSEVELDNYTSPIELKRDTKDRYHCCHGAGVHTIVLPWIHDIQKFITGGDGQLFGELTEQRSAIVEHLVCTKPMSSSPSEPVLGLSVVRERGLGTSLLCLTADLQCVTLPLQSSTVIHRAPVSSSHSSAASVSPMKRVQQQPFHEHISRILQRNTSNPIILAGDKVASTPQECFQLLTRATQVYREEYIQKLDQAQQEIDKRVQLLVAQKDKQKKELQECLRMREILQEGGRNLAEKYEDCKDKQSQLMKRAERVLQCYQAHTPILTDAERNMSKELNEIDRKLQDFSMAIKQLKVKQNYQTKMISQQKKSEVKKVTFTKTQTESLRTLLKDEGDEIGELVQKLDQLQTGMEGNL